MVDPKDGTSDFLRGLAGSTISVGLLHDGKSVIGEDGTPVQYTTEATMAKVSSVSTSLSKHKTSLLPHNYSVPTGIR